MGYAAVAGDVWSCRGNGVLVAINVKYRLPHCAEQNTKHTPQIPRSYRNHPLLSLYIPMTAKISQHFP
jgi:hypothetical protein